MATFPPARPRPHRRRLPRGRPAAVAVELALVLPLIVFLMFGIWDVGRMIEVQQLLSNAARDGARQAAVGSMLDPTNGSQVNVLAGDVQNVVTGYLSRNGINTTGMNVVFTDLTSPSVQDPYQAQYLDHIRVTVQLPFNNVRWTLVNYVFNLQNSSLYATADWYTMVDVNVIVPTTIPTN